MKDIFSGDLVRLSAFDPEELGKAYANWIRDSELSRLMDTGAAVLHSARARTNFFEKEIKAGDPALHYFAIRALDGDRLLGDIGLDVINDWSSREAFVGIAIANRSDWGKGYGTDAMKTILRFAFAELNLRRVSLIVFEYNPRAVRSYEKAGFRHEGRIRGALLRDGKRWDALSMGILAEEWKEKYDDPTNQT